jgi:hypothetical protein
LRDPLVLGDTLVATAGAPARLVVTAKDTAKDGTPNYHIAITGLELGLAGRLPVRPTMPIVEHIAAGMAIPAQTLAVVGFLEGKIRVAVPLPFKLSNEPPASGYTPAPLRTAAPIINRRRPTATPVATPTGSPAAPSSAPTGPPSSAPTVSSAPASPAPS